MAQDARAEGRSPPVPVGWAVDNLGNQPKPAPFPADAVLQALKHTTIPVLHIGGDLDIVFPNRQLRTPHPTRRPGGMTPGVPR